APFHVIEVLNIGANKGEAIKQLAEQYNIPQERIMAFGDGGNDLEMIDYAGVGVAMENAVSELKNLATHHTATNEEHGVAGFLRSEEHTSELQSRFDLVCRLLL